MPTSTRLTPQGSLSRKLLWYGAAAGLTGLATTEANAQIRYTDLNPDLLIRDNDPGTAYDFDGDGDPELLFREQTLTTSGNPSTYCLTNRETTLGADQLTGVIGTLVAGYTYFLPLPAGTVVGPANKDLLPVTRNFQSLTFQGSDPNSWQGQTAFMGLRFSLNGAEHYGWVRITLPAGGGQFTVLDLAYNATPNTPITTGDVGATAVEPGALPNGYLFSEFAPSPVVSRSTFALAVGRPEHVRADVFDVSGRQVATILDQTLPALQRQELVFDASNLPSGVYVVRVVGESFVTSRRVVVAH